MPVFFTRRMYFKIHNPRLTPCRAVTAVNFSGFGWNFYPEYFEAVCSLSSVLQCHLEQICPKEADHSVSLN